MNDIQKQRDALGHKVFLMMFHVLWVFGLPAVAAFFVGGWLDRTYSMRPYGSALAGFVALAISWTIIFKMYSGIKKKYGELDEADKLAESKEGEIKE
jgi:hypothetical protein